MVVIVNKNSSLSLEWVDLIKKNFFVLQVNNFCMFLQKKTFKIAPICFDSLI